MTQKTPYFGFLEDLNPILRERAIRNLSAAAIDKIGAYSIGSDVVEEIVRLGGSFYTSDEASPSLPFSVGSDDIFFARVSRSDTIAEQHNPADSETDWRCLTVYQYAYRLYLKRLLAEGKLRKEELEKI